MEKKDQFTIRQPEYLESFEAFRDEESFLQIATKVKEQIDKKGGNNLNCLDSMAGTGVVGRKMKEVFDQIHVVFQDKSSKMLTSEVYQEENRVESDASYTGLQESSFDIIFCRGGLNNVAAENYPAILREYVRLLKRDGIAILQDHFARTQEERDVINRIETEVAAIKGRSDETYVPTVQELKQLIQTAGGKITDEQSFKIRLSLKDRFIAKGINNPDLSKIKEVLENQTQVQYEKTADDIVIIYPITTVTFSKNPEIELHDTEKAIERGWQFLEAEQQTGFFPSYISSDRNTASTKQAPREIFSSIVIAHTLPPNTPHEELRRAILHFIETQTQQLQLTFFEDHNLLPPDTDTNSLGYSVLLENDLTTSEAANKILDSIIEYRDKEGRVQVWLSEEKENRLDHVVGANVAYFARLLGREAEMHPTEQWLMSMLDSGEYLNGSRYYHSPDSFLYFLGRLAKFPEIGEKLTAKLKQHLQQRIGTTEYPLDLAMRITLADSLGINNEKEKQKLLILQEKDGSWSVDALYREGTKPVFYRNKSVPTAFALQALSL